MSTIMMGILIELALMESMRRLRYIELYRTFSFAYNPGLLGQIGS